MVRFGRPAEPPRLPPVQARRLSPGRGSRTTSPSPAGRRHRQQGRRDMAKKVAGQLKLQVQAGSANPSPPIGPALGQRGINIMEFCKAFNAATQEMEKGMPIPVVITYYQDKSFTFAMKQPPVSYWLKKEAKITVRFQDGPARALRPAPSPRLEIKSIAEAKMKDLERSGYRRCNGDDRGLRPRHGPGSGGLRSWRDW